MSPKKQPNSRSCFVCGVENPIGLKMSWYSFPAEDRVKAAITVPEEYNSYPGFVHGGIIAAMLDETAGRALMVNGDDDLFMVTTRLETKYRRPTPTCQPLEVVGWVTRRDRSRAHVAAEVRLQDGTVTARAEATVVRPPRGFLTGWQAEQEFWKVYEDE